jgi:hypothetical protein
MTRSGTRLRSILEFLRRISPGPGSVDRGSCLGKSMPPAAFILCSSIINPRLAMNREYERGVAVAH